MTTHRVPRRASLCENSQWKRNEKKVERQCYHIFYEFYCGFYFAPLCAHFWQLQWLDWTFRRILCHFIPSTLASPTTTTFNIDVDCQESWSWKSFDEKYDAKSFPLFFLVSWIVMSDIHHDEAFYIFDEKRLSWCIKNVQHVTDHEKKILNFHFLSHPT